MRNFLFIMLFSFCIVQLSVLIAQQPKAIEIKEATKKSNQVPTTTTPKKKTNTPKPTTPSPTNREKKSAPTPTSPQPSTPEVVTSTLPVTTVTEVEKPTPYDTIIKMGGKKIPVLTVRIGANEVNFTLLDGKPQQLRRKDIEKILYKTGKVEVFNKPVFQVVSQTSWEAIYVTDNPAEVEGFFEIDKIKASASSNQRSMKDAKQSATIRLQKKAATMGAVMVLITSRQSKGGYGEVPGYDIEGIAYASEPKPKPVKK